MDLLQKCDPCLHCRETGAGSGTAVRAQRQLLYYQLRYEYCMLLFRKCNVTMSCVTAKKNHTFILNLGMQQMVLFSL